jgi:predicted amidohydrolase
MSTTDLTLALWQTPYAADVPSALLALDVTAAQARAQGADVLVCPEMSLTGYLLGPQAIAALAEPTEGPLLQAVAGIARRHGIALVCGWPGTTAGRPHNAVAFIGADGALLNAYAKAHLFGDADRAQFTPGPALSAVFSYRGWRLGLLICYDVEFPETVRHLAQQGADAVLVPTANMRAFDEVPTLLVPARACENRVFVAYANACGREGDTEYGGLSTVAGPLGTVWAQAGRDTALSVVRLSVQALADARSSSQLPQRRCDLY